jgi:hypothetical protein
LDPRELGARIVLLGRRLGSLHHDLVRTAVAYDLSGMWATSGHSTCAAWIAETLAVSLGTAREWLRVGHALTTLPDVDASFHAGRLSYGQVRTLTRIAIDHPDRASELVDLAERTPARHLAVALAAWIAANEDPDALARRHRRETGLSARTEPDGMGVITLRLPPLHHGAVMAAIDATVMTTKSAQNASTDASSSHTVADDGRASLAQQRAAALVDLVTTGGASVATELIIHVRADGATLGDGTPIADTLAERLVPESFIRAMIHDAESHPINVSGRHRHPTDRQKLVVTERDRTCTCGATTFLHHHHEPPFEESKRTLVDELQLKCHACHRRRHAGDRG